MGRHEKLRQKILSATSDAKIRFDDLRSFLRYFGFDERIRGDHHLFRREDVEERMNLQRDGHKAKPYQVRQVRAIILRYGIGAEADDA